MGGSMLGIEREGKRRKEKQENKESRKTGKTRKQEKQEKGENQEKQEKQDKSRNGVEYDIRQILIMRRGQYVLGRTIFQY